MKIRLFAIMLCSAQLIGCATTGAGSIQHAADMQPGKSRVKASPARTGGITRERLARKATFGVQRVVNAAGWVTYHTLYVIGMVWSGALRGDFDVAPGAEWVDAFQ